LAELRAEAERRVRSGEAQLEVAHDLDVPPTTLSGWATRGGWRRRDLDREVYEERARIAAKTRESMQAIEKPPRPKQVWLGRQGEIDIQTPGLRFVLLAQAMMEEGRLEDAERCARTADRLMNVLNRLERRDQQLDLHDQAMYENAIARQGPPTRDPPDEVKDEMERQLMEILADRSPWGDDDEEEEGLAGRSSSSSIENGPPARYDESGNGAD